MGVNRIGKGETILASIGSDFLPLRRLERLRLSKLSLCFGSFINQNCHNVLVILKDRQIQSGTMIVTHDVPINTCTQQALYNFPTIKHDGIH